jgi:hypothetical protein
MNCDDAKHLIHLDAGDDLRTEEKTQLASHLELCHDCQSYRSGMTAAMSALMVLRDHPEAASELRLPSVWPAVARDIRRLKIGSEKVRRFNLQVVALSVCSLALAVVTMVQSLSSLRGSLNHSGEFMPAQAVSNSAVPAYPQDFSTQQKSTISAPNQPSLPQSF